MRYALTGWTIGRCQYEQSARRWPLPVAVGRAAMVTLRRRWWDRRVPHGLGPPSVFAAGQAVRVRSRAELTDLLDKHHRQRGLEFTESQWAFCGQILAVDRVVRQMLDDHGALRPISRAVMLTGATCDAGGFGCGRSCGLLWKDEWLEPASSVPDPPAAAGTGTPSGPEVRIRSLHEIRAQAGVGGRIGGLTPPLDAARHAGHTARVERHVHMSERVASVIPAPPPGDWFILEGVRCEGRELAGPAPDSPPCDRRCALVWHRSWLDFDPQRSSGGDPVLAPYPLA